MNDTCDIHLGVNNGSGLVGDHFIFLYNIRTEEGAIYIPPLLIMKLDEKNKKILS